MTTATDSLIAQDEIVSDDEVEILNAARTIAVRLASRARKLSYDERVTGRNVGPDVPGAFELGLMASNYEDIETAVFQALNVTRAYGHVSLSEAQVHNHKPDAL